MNTFGKEFRNFALKFGKFTIWNKIAIYLELYNYSYSEFADKVINGIIAGGEIVPEKSNKYSCASGTEAPSTTYGSRTSGTRPSAL